MWIWRVQRSISRPRRRNAFGLAPAGVGDPTEIGALRVSYRMADRAFVDGAKEAFTSDDVDAAYLDVLDTLLPDESLAVPIEEATVDAEA